MLWIEVIAFRVVEDVAMGEGPIEPTNLCQPT